jgi:hypothetical protein
MSIKWHVRGLWSGRRLAEALWKGERAALAPSSAVFWSLESRSAEVDDPDVKSLFVDLVRKTLEDERWGRLALAVFDLVREILKKRRRKIAVIADDVFQAIGLDKAAAYVKGLLNMIEHPVYRYENIVVLVATSEGVSRREIGRHRWAELMSYVEHAEGGSSTAIRQDTGAKAFLRGRLALDWRQSEGARLAL